MVLLKILPEAHTHQQIKHGVMKMIHHTDGGRSAGMESKPRYQNLQRRLPRAGVDSHPGGVENLRREVAAEEAPGRAVGAGTDV